MSTLLRTLPASPQRQQGSLMLVTLVILLVITLLGMATVDTTGLEMQMSSNSRQQQATFEAAEYALSWVENDLKASGYFDGATQLSNLSCGTICFTATCPNGYCFDGGTPNPATGSEDSCTLNVPTVENYANADLWADSGRHKTLVVPDSGLTAKYIIEYWCYTAKDPAQDKTFLGNAARMYRITALATSTDGRVRTMLRSVIREP